MEKLSGSFQNVAAWVLGTVLTVGAMSPFAALAQDDLKPGTCYTASGQESAKEALARATSGSGYVAVAVARTPGYRDFIITYVLADKPISGTPGLFGGGLRVSGTKLNKDDAAQKFCIVADYEHVWVRAVAGVGMNAIPEVFSGTKTEAALTNTIQVGWEIVSIALTPLGTFDIMAGDMGSMPTNFKGKGNMIYASGNGEKIKVGALEDLGYSSGIKGLLPPPRQASLY